jgi:23S rRNA (guanine745-N1)-methyltransferase
MIPLRCPVRACTEALTLSGRRLTCRRGHAFDRAREGYWNLLQPQDRRSRAPGDTDEAIRARRQFLSRGHADGFIAALRGVLDTIPAPPGATVLDAGCGEGTMTLALAAGRGWDLYGLDLSARALGLAARIGPDATWIAANADRALPLPDASVDLVLSLFARRPAAEFRRVVRPGGVVVIALPGPEDLVELREIAQGHGARRERVPALRAELGAAALRLTGEERWTARVRLDRESIQEALAMTYRGARRSQSDRISGTEAIDATLAAEILWFERP